MSAGKIVSQVRGINENCNSVAHHSQQVGECAENSLDAVSGVAAIGKALGILLAIQDKLPEALEEAGRAKSQAENAEGLYHNVFGTTYPHNEHARILQSSLPRARDNASSLGWYLDVGGGYLDKAVAGLRVALEELGKYEELREATVPAAENAHAHAATALDAGRQYLQGISGLPEAAGPTQQ